jgi:hypothetical protein
MRYRLSKPALRYEEEIRTISFENKSVLPYILKSNPRYFFSFGGLKNQMQIRFACGLNSQPRA